MKKLYLYCNLYKALAWVRENGERYGADPDFVVVTGGSAGGHLCGLIGLTANDPEYQPGFEHVDTRVSACLPIYGVYDWTDRFGFWVSAPNASATPRRAQVPNALSSAPL